MCRFALKKLRDRCVASYDLASLYRGRHSTLDRWSAKIAKRIGTRASALLQLHYSYNYTTLHYTTLITLHYSTQQLQLQLHHATLHSLHYTAATTTATTTTTLLDTTLDYTTLYYTTVHNTQYTTLHYTTLVTPHCSYNYHYKYSYNFNYNFNYNYTTLHYTTPH